MRSFMIAPPSLLTVLFSPYYTGLNRTVKRFINIDGQNGTKRCSILLLASLEPFGNIFFRGVPNGYVGAN